VRPIEAQHERQADGEGSLRNTMWIIFASILKYPGISTVQYRRNMAMPCKAHFIGVPGRQERNLNPMASRENKIFIGQSISGGFKMLWAVCALFLALWLVSMAVSVTLGGLAHLLLVAAIAVILFRVWQGKTTT
jgi:hypothetical protein